MPTEKPRIFVEIRYHEAAQAYLRSLPPEHFMEAKTQATQREITVESFALIGAQRADFQYFNELLVQYPPSDPDAPDPQQVVPDNMVVLHDQLIQAEGSYDVPLQPVGPFWVLEYVSKSSRRKDYDDNMYKYEHELKVPYYLLFTPDIQELTLYRHNKKKYVTVIPNGNGRCPLPEVELEVALLDGWVRFWFRGELLPLPADLLREVKKIRRQLQRTEKQLRAAQRLTEAEKQTRLTAERRAKAAQKRATQEKQRAEQEKQRAEQEKQRADALAAENERLRQLLAQRGE